MTQGLFITFEGPDGSGKTTQIGRLADYLEKEKIPFIKTREPGGTTISDLIRGIILNPEYQEMKNETEVLLYAASRSQHVFEKIIPALKEGKVVLCDRFVDASIAYQGYGLNIDLETIKTINLFATGGLKPNRTYMFDISPEVGRDRLISRLSHYATNLDRIEQKAIEYHETVRKGFHEIASHDSKRVKLIHAEQSIEQIFSIICDDFKRLWNNKDW